MKNKFGPGSLSVILDMIAHTWSYNIDGYCLGDKVLEYWNMPQWSNPTNSTGIHYTVYYSFLLLIPAIILSVKYKDNFLSRLGKWWAISISILLVLGLFIFQSYSG